MIRGRSGTRLVGASVLLLATAIFVTQVVGIFAHQFDWPGPFVDWRTYANAAGRLLGGEGIYAPEQLSGPYHLTDMLLVGYAYPPASVPLMIPFQGYPLGLVAWITVNLGLLLTALWAIASRAWPGHRAVAFAIVLAGLSAFPPFKEGMLAMSTNVGLAGAIGWVAVGLPPRQAGVFGGILAVVKVFSGAVGLATVGSKLEALAITIAVVAALTLVTLPIVGVGAWIDFGTALTSAVPDCGGLNVSIACALGPSLGPGLASLIGVMIGGLAALAMLGSRQPFVLSVLAAIAIMAPANNLHIHYWIILYVLGVVSVARLATLMRRSVVID